MRKNGKFLITVFRKLTFSSQYVKWNSFCYDSCKIHLIKTLTLRALRIYRPSFLELELDFTKSVFLENGYPIEIVQSSITALKLKPKKELVFKSEKYPVYLKLP